MQERTEQYTLTDGQGRISLRKGDAIGLFVDDKPLLYQWSSNCGTVADDYYHFAALEMGAETLDLRDIVSHEPILDKSLTSQILPLLNQFPDGEYTLQLAMLPEDHYVTIWRPKYPQLNIYLSLDTLYLLPTQQEDTFDVDRILHYMDRIQSGERPWAITVAATRSTEFILDGHHKLYAYRELSITPWRLVIQGQWEKNIGFDDWPTATTGYIPQSWFEYHLDIERLGR